MFSPCPEAGCFLFSPIWRLGLLSVHTQPCLPLEPRRFLGPRRGLMGDDPERGAQATEIFS